MVEVPDGGGGQHLNWLQILLTAISAPSSIGIAIGAWKVWTWHFGRKDAKEVSKLSSDDQLRVDVRENSARTDKRTDNLFDRYTEALKTKDAENLVIGRDRDRFRSIALHWYLLFRDSVQALRQARSYADAFGRRLRTLNAITEDELPRYDYTPPKTIPPDFEEPYPKDEEEKQ